MAQFALPLRPLPPADAARIVIHSGNRAVADALAEPERWPYRTAVLRGPPRSGKTLLGSWFATSGKGEFVDGAERADETALFHRWNRVQAEGGALLLAIDAPAWTIALPDLRSRIGAALPLAITDPDEAGAAELMQALAAQRGLALGEGAAAYLLPRMERSYEAIERIVAEIDRLSLERKLAATLSLWRDALDAVEGPEQGRLL